MSPVRILVLAIAAIAAIGLAFVVRGAFSDKKRPTAASAEAAIPAKPVAQVLVAKRDLTVGTRLTEEDMGWQDWPLDAVNPAFFTDGQAAAPEAKGAAKAVKVAAQATGVVGAAAIKSLEGSVVREDILSGEPIVARKVVRGGEGGYMSVVLTPGMRALAVPINAETGVGGFILPGDRVDVLQSHETKGQEDAQGTAEKVTVAETILRNVKVLAVDQTTAPGKDTKSIVGGTVTLEVSGVEAETLMRAKALGDIVLSLRSFSDAHGPTGAGPRAEVAGVESTVVRVHRGTGVSSTAVSR